MKKRIGIIGGGAWGTAVGASLAAAGHKVELWVFEQDVIDDITSHHRNERYLPGVDLPKELHANGSFEAVAGEKDFVIIATPSLYTLAAARRLATVARVAEGRSIIGVLTKGFIETERGPKLIIEMLENYLPGFYKESLVYISGPSHAEEVARGKLTALIAASKNPQNAIRFKHLLNVAPMMVFSSLDVVGVQVSAAVKNVIAIAFGMLDALKDSVSFVGDNTESLLFAAGLNEIQVLASALGSSHPATTLTSIAGVGDLDVTCRSVHGRNRRFGREIILKDALAPFRNIDELINRFGELGYMPEGAVAARHVKKFIEQYKLRMPISNEVYRVLNKEVTPLKAMRGFLHSLAGRYELRDHLD